MKACQWFILAMTSLHGFHFERAQAGYERIRALLTPAQLATAAARAKTWQRKWRQSAALKAAKILENDAMKSQRRGVRSPAAVGKAT